MKSNKKLLITRSKTSQIKPILEQIEKDPFFSRKNYKVFKRKIPKWILKKYSVVICDNNPRFITGKPYQKIEGQTMIQMTHGIWIKKPNHYLYWEQNGTNLILSPNDWSTKLYGKMGYPENAVLKYGYPRIQYYKSINQKEILDFLRNRIKDFDKYKEIVIFTPSWNNGVEKDDEYNIDYILERMNSDALLIIRPHFLNSKKVKYRSFKGIKRNIHLLNTNFSGEKLMLIADKLYTDYSSIIFDFAALKGKENAFYYNPLLQKDQSPRMNELLEKQYSDWGKGITDFGNEINWKEMEYYNINNPEKTIKLIIDKIKELLS